MHIGGGGGRRLFNSVLQVPACSTDLAQPENTTARGYFRSGILGLAEAGCSQEGDRVGRNPGNATGNLAVL